MAATVRAKAAKKATQPTPAIPDRVPDFEPPRLASGTTDPERVVLFYIDDTAYSVTLRPGLNVGLRYLHIARTEGEMQAMAYLLEKLLGSEGYEALMGYDDLTPGQFAEICGIASKLTLGALELPKA